MTSMILPGVAILALLFLLIVIYLLWAQDKPRKEVRGKILVEMTLENRHVWHGLCEVHGSRIRAPWNKAKDTAEGDDRIQEFFYDKDHVFIDVYPQGSRFQVSVSKVFLDEKKVTAQLPVGQCTCAGVHGEDCPGNLPMQLSPDVLGMLEQEKVTGVTMQSGMVWKEMLDKMGDFIQHMIPAWVTYLVYIVLVVGTIATGVLSFLNFTSGGNPAP